MTTTPDDSSRVPPESSASETATGSLQYETVLLDEVADNAPEAPRGRRWPRVLLILGIVLAVLLAAAAAGAWMLAKRLESNVSTIEGFEAPRQPAGGGTGTAALAPVNILIMGSDNRGSGNSSESEAHEIAGERSDTTILVHISADRSRALAVSIPRDTYLDLPACASESGQWQVKGKFNSAFTYGGPNCTVQAVEQLSGVQVDHAVVVDFLGFKHVVDALGGVEVCLAEPTKDAQSGLDLPAGWQKVSGDQALAFVRARYNLGDGSDIQRIARQQQFISSAIRQATDARLILEPVKLIRVLDAATKSLSVDPGLDQVGEMLSMAQSLKGLSPENIKFVTLPFSYSSDFNNVLVNEPVANEIWAAIAADEDWPKAPDTSATALTVAPSAISVLVTNGNGQDNAATNAAADLNGVGFAIAGLAMADSSDYTDSLVVYNPADAEAARTLQAAVPGSQLQADPARAPGALTLIVGSSYSAATPVSVPRTPAGTDADPLPTTADVSVCSS